MYLEDPINRAAALTTLALRIIAQDSRRTLDLIQCAAPREAIEKHLERRQQNQRAVDECFHLRDMEIARLTGV